MPYTAPVDEYLFLLTRCTSALRLAREGGFPNLSEDLLPAIVGEAGKFASGPLASIDRSLDRVGARYVDGAVVTAPGHRELYRDFVAGGWMGLAQPEAFGGQDLPITLNTACLEFWHSASMGFAMGTMLTMGAAEVVRLYGDPALQALYLPKLVSGEWTAAMVLTEPGAGSNLSGVATRAEPAADGSYRIFGSKIFISYGDHDIAENLVHIMLARMPGAPAGTRGLSLFLTPKFIPDADGNPGARNDFAATAIERKLGQHGSPTCAMTYGQSNGAQAWLIGKPNEGLSAMFTMMNGARLAVAAEGVAAAEAAWQRAREYAHERRQGRPPGWSEQGQAPIIHHPDVQMMLMRMRALTVTSRLIVLAAADAIDRAQREQSVEARAAGQLDADLLIPIAKAFATDSGVEVASLAVQTFGGLGYIEDTGIAQLLRDVRITPIYEGANGVQAIDLVSRKLPMTQGAAAMILRLKRVGAAVAQAGAPVGQAPSLLAEAIGDLERVTQFMLAANGSDPLAALSGATSYLRLFGLVAGAGFLAEAVLASDGARRAELSAVLRFHAARLLPEASALARAIIDGADALSGAGAALGVA